MKLHTGDLVVIITGKDKGKTGRILRVLPDQGRVVVTGINMRTRHIRKTVQAPGRVVRYEASLHVSNVMAVDPKTKKPTRIGYKTDNGMKKRIAKKSGEELVSGKKLKTLVEKDQERGEKGEGSGDEGKKIPHSSFLIPHSCIILPL